MCVFICLSREIMIEMLSLRKSKMRDTMGNKYSQLFGLRFNALNFQLFSINWKLRFWINNIFSSVYFCAEILAKIRATTNRSVHAQIKTYGQSRKIVEKILMNASKQLLHIGKGIEKMRYLRISFYTIKKTQSFIYRLRK